MRTPLHNKKDVVVLVWLLCTTILTGYGLLTPREIEYALTQAEIIEALQVKLNSSYSLLAKQSSYYIEQVGSYYILANGTNGKLEAYDTNKTLIQEWADGNLTASGGLIYLKEVEWNTNITLNDNVFVIEQYQGQHRYYSNQAKFLMVRLAADPDTGGWDASEEGRIWYNTDEHVFKYWNGTHKVTFGCEAEGDGGEGYVSDSFLDESKVSAKDNVYVNTTGGHVRLADYSDGDPEATFQCTAGNDLRIESRNETYSIAHSVGYYTGNYPLEIGQYYSESYDYHVMRNFLKFDTTSIPSDVTIFGATLSIYGMHDFSDIDFVIHLQKWTGETPIGTEDFTLYDGVNYDDGNFNTANFHVDAWNDIIITNFTLIQQGGYTKICIRSSRDISETPPTITGEYVSAYTSLDESSYAAKLTVYYGYGTIDEFDSSASDGRVYNYHTTWSTCRGATTGTSVSSSDTSYAMESSWDNTYYRIARGFFYFDTSSIPDNAVITAVVLSVYGGTYYDSNICAQKGTQAGTLTTADFDSFTGSLYGYVTWEANQYNNITFNTQGRSDIDKAGVTKICIREYSHDYLNSQPSGYNRDTIYFNESSYPPILIVAWKIYESTGILYSTNLLSGKSVASIDQFNYTCTIPAQTTLEVLFSQDNSTWKNSTDGSDWQSLSAGTKNTISLSSLGWSGANFYHKVRFTNTDDDTAKLDYVAVIYTKP